MPVSKDQCSPPPCPILLTYSMERTIPPQAMARRPLTERAAQGRTQQPGRRMEGSGRRAYGKGGTASSRAVLSDHFLDENEIEDHIAKMNLGQVASPSPSKNDAKPFPPAPTAFVARKAKHMESVPVSVSIATSFRCLFTPKRSCTNP